MKCPTQCGISSNHELCTVIHRLIKTQLARITINKHHSDYMYQKNNFPISARKKDAEELGNAIEP
jgi:hypothetical protein